MPHSDCALSEQCLCGVNRVKNLQDLFLRIDLSGGYSIRNSASLELRPSPPARDGKSWRKYASGAVMRDHDAARLSDSPGRQNWPRSWLVLGSHLQAKPVSCPDRAVRVFDFDIVVVEAIGIERGGRRRLR